MVNQFTIILRAFILYYSVHVSNTEGSQGRVQFVGRGVQRRGIKGAYAPDEILNSMFLPLMKKALTWGIEADANTSHALCTYNKFSALPPLHLGFAPWSERGRIRPPPLKLR